MHSRAADPSVPLIRKAVTLFAVAIGIPVLLQSPGLSALIGRAYVGPVALGFLPLPPQQHHFALLLVLFGLWLANDKRMAQIEMPSRRERIVSGALVAIASVAALVVTHPSTEQLVQLRALDQTRGLLFTALSYACLLLPAAAAYGLCFPWATLRRCIPAILACVLLALGFVATGVLASIWHLPLVRPALNLAAWLLQLVDASAVSVDAHHALITFYAFTVRIGPQCAALDGVMLFLLLAGALWWQRSGVQPWRAAVAAIIGALLLFFLNGARIAMIMIIGIFSREVAVDLFHGLIGIAMLMAMLWLFDRIGMAKQSA